MWRKCKLALIGMTIVAGASLFPKIAEAGQVELFAFVTWFDSFDGQRHKNPVAIKTCVTGNSGDQKCFLPTVEEKAGCITEFMEVLPGIEKFPKDLGDFGYIWEPISHPVLGDITVTCLRLGVSLDR